MTCSRVLHPIESLLSMTMGIAETLQSYSDRYWELYNEIEGSNEQVATSTFKLGLSYDFKLRESLTKQPHEDMHQLMRHIEEYRGWRMTGCRTGKRLRSCLTIGRRLEGGYINKGLKGRFWGGGGNPSPKAEGINLMFTELMPKILEKIKHESFFCWWGKMSWDLGRRNQNLFYTYHCKKGHTTEKCKRFKDHLE